MNMLDTILDVFRKRKIKKFLSDVPTGLRPLREISTVNVIIDVEEPGFDVLKEDILACHAPHTFEEKNKPYFSAPSGGTSIQHLLLGALELAKNGVMTIEKVVELLSHNPAILFKINKRGFVREGYYADLVLINPNAEHVVTNADVYYKCGWTAYSGMKLSNSVTISRLTT